MRNDREVPARLRSDLRGKNETVCVNTSAGRFLNLEGPTSGSHKGGSSSDGETGKLPKQIKIHPDALTGKKRHTGQELSTTTRAR